MADSLIGQKLGQYEIQMVLGKGGMSTVYLAYQPSMERSVAVKVLPREFLHDDTFLLRFQAEVRTIARLEHLHILPVYDSGETDGIPYIVMRYLTGGSLADLIDGGLVTYPTMARVVEQVGDALDYAHEQGVIHRDLKPSNILLDEKGNAFLSDFGIARTAHAIDLTGSRVIGTPPYVAPEMVQKGEKVTGLADVYALGVITFEMLTGRPPYKDEDPMKVLMAHVLEPVPSARAIDPGIHPAIEAVVQRCLAKAPVERYRTASAFAGSLSQAIDASLKASGLATPAPYAAETVPRPLSGSVDPGQPVAPPDFAVETLKRPASYAVSGDGLAADSPVQAPPRPAPAREPTRPERLLSGRGLGCALTAGAILVMAIGVAITAWVLTDGDLQSLFVLLTPIPTGEGSGPIVAGTNFLPATITPAGDGAEPTGAAPAVLPPGVGRIAFASNRDGDFEIFLINSDGTNVTQLTYNEFQDFDPAWSPDGSRLAFISRPTSDGPSQVIVMNADGGDLQTITPLDATYFDPDWSPDGAWLAVAANLAGTYDIYIMRPDGSDICQITASDRQELTPRWSPDGTRLGYHARIGNDRTTSELYVIPVDPAQECARVVQGESSQLTDNEFTDQWLDWSPDGLSLVYSTTQGEDTPNHAIFVLDLTFNQTRLLVGGAGQNDDPVWSGDGRLIVFDSDRDGDEYFDLYLVGVETGEVQQLTDDAADDVAPAFQPLP